MYVHTTKMGMRWEGRPRICPNKYAEFVSRVMAIISIDSLQNGKASLNVKIFVCKWHVLWRMHFYLVWYLAVSMYIYLPIHKYVCKLSSIFVYSFNIFLNVIYGPTSLLKLYIRVVFFQSPLKETIFQYFSYLFVFNNIICVKFFINNFYRRVILNNEVVHNKLWKLNNPLFQNQLLNLNISTSKYWHSHNLMCQIQNRVPINYGDAKIKLFEFVQLVSHTF